MERPITLAPWEVRAFLSGRKTRITRPMVPQPYKDVVAIREDAPAGHAMEPGDWCSWTVAGDISAHVRFWWSSPLGVPGDVAWGREFYERAFRPTETNNGCVYRADYMRPTQLDAGLCFDRSRWTPPSRMPRWASRLTLRIESVRVHRLAEITEEEARAEGIPQMHGEAVSAGLCEPTRSVTPYGAAGPDCRDVWDNRKSSENYAALWDAQFGKRYPAASSPWVWAATVSVTP